MSNGCPSDCHSNQNSRQAPEKSAQHIFLRLEQAPRLLGQERREVLALFQGQANSALALVVAEKDKAENDQGNKHGCSEDEDYCKDVFHEFLLLAFDP